eukprot:TRINITY_DN24042_c0_g1_i1.p1 TRINITY_DN24042_c0_g1~~TRINITY_DN24042_c0_g1_i1.p1  ORF type:complete len:506 (+),score=62.01 TRINITY_DN24042_c0_g1_i1:1437-2954(+)
MSVNDSLLHQFLDVVDVDQTGTIEIGEFVNALRDPASLLAMPTDEDTPKKVRREIKPASPEEAADALASLHQQLSASKTRIVDLFKRMDSNGNGILSRRELRQGLNAEGYKVTAAQFKAIMAVLDKDFSGEISLMELEKGINRAVKEVNERGLIHDPYEVALNIVAELDSGKRMIDGKQITDARTFYKAIDKDGNGALDISEVASGIRRLGIPAADSTVLEFVRAIDSHGNGNGLVGMQELAEALKNPDRVFDKKRETNVSWAARKTALSPSSSRASLMSQSAEVQANRSSPRPGSRKSYAKIYSSSAPQEQYESLPRSISPLGQAQTEATSLTIEIPETPSPSGPKKSLLQTGPVKSVLTRGTSSPRGSDGVGKRSPTDHQSNSASGVHDLQVDLALSPSSLSSISPSFSPNGQQPKSSSTTSKRPSTTSPRHYSNAPSGRSSIPGRNNITLVPELEALNVDIAASPEGAQVGSAKMPGRSSFSYRPEVEALSVEIPTSPESIN